LNERRKENDMIPGRYIATCGECYIGTSKSGTKYLAIKLGVGTELKTTKIYFSQRSMGIARAKLSNIGFDIDLNGLEVLSENPGYFMGKEITVDIWQEEYNGRTMDKVEIPFERPRVSREDLEGITDSLRKEKKGKSKSKDPDASPEAEAKVPTPERKLPDVLDSDVPF
jgi:hypothetical protein